MRRLVAEDALAIAPPPLFAPPRRALGASTLRRHRRAPRRPPGWPRGPPLPPNQSPPLSCDQGLAPGPPELNEYPPSPQERGARATKPPAMAGQEELVRVLGASLSPEAPSRKAAEALLEAGAQQHGFGAALVAVALAAEVAPGLRQLAAVVLKKWVRDHWDASAPHFAPPLASEEEKARVREALPTGLTDPDRRLRTAVAMALGAVARWDVPDQWPDLLPSLIQAITARKNPCLGEGRAPRRVGVGGWVECRARARSSTAPGAAPTRCTHRPTLGAPPTLPPPPRSGRRNPHPVHVCG